jgi:hypothetical protein
MPQNSGASIYYYMAKNIYYCPKCRYYGLYWDEEKENWICPHCNAENIGLLPKNKWPENFTNLDGDGI